MTDIDEPDAEAKPGASVSIVHSLSSKQVHTSPSISYENLILEHVLVAPPPHPQLSKFNNLESRQFQPASAILVLRLRH